MPRFLQTHIAIFRVSNVYEGSIGKEDTLVIYIYIYNFLKLAFINEYTMRLLVYIYIYISYNCFLDTFSSMTSVMARHMECSTMKRIAPPPCTLHPAPCTLQHRQIFLPCPFAAAGYHRPDRSSGRPPNCSCRPPSWFSSAPQTRPHCQPWPSGPIWRPPGRPAVAAAPSPPWLPPRMPRRL